MFALKNLALIMAINAASLSPDLNGEKARMQEWGPTPLLQKHLPVSPETCSAGVSVNQGTALPLLQKRLEGGDQSLLNSIEELKLRLSWLPSPPGIDSPTQFNMNMPQVLRQRDLLKDYSLTG